MRDGDRRSSSKQRRDDRHSSGKRADETRTDRVAALHRAGGNQAIQSQAMAGGAGLPADTAGGARQDEPATDDGSTTSPSGGPGQSAREDASGDPAADMCTRCAKRFRAGKPLNCEECERELPSGGESTHRGSGLDEPVQPKLRVSVPNDRDEREAERIATAVVRESGRASTPRSDESAGTVPVQRLCGRCAKRARQGKPLDCEECEAELDRAADAGDPSAVDGEAERRIATARLGGRSLPEGTRTFFQSRMGYDFGDVRIHTASRADAAARAIDARAFTVGRDVVFRSGEYRPHTRSGKRLLAHELTHVLQQGGGREAAQSDGTPSESDGE